jgi:hypothetical protein
MQTTTKAPDPTQPATEPWGMLADVVRDHFGGTANVTLLER